MNGSSFLLPSADLNDLKSIRQFAELKLTEFGIDSEVVYDLLLALTEAVTNIILHGYGSHPGWVKIDLQPQGKDIRLHILDRAPAYDPTQVLAPDLSLPLEKRPLGGLGVYLIRRNVDQIRYQVTAEGGNELVLIKENVIKE